MMRALLFIRLARRKYFLIVTPVGMPALVSAATRFDLDLRWSETADTPAIALGAPRLSYDLAALRGCQEVAWALFERFDWVQIPKWLDQFYSLKQRDHSA